MILLVTGGRDFCEQRDGADHMGERMALGWALDWLSPSRVIVGDATGADRWAVIWCERRGVEFTRVTADWDKLGKAAGPIRNQRMVDMKPDAGLRFPGGRGTGDCCHRMSKAGIPVYEIKFPITEKGVASTSE